MFISKTHIVKRSGKYAVYDLKNRRQLTKLYDTIEELDKNIYKGKNKKNSKWAFLSATFCTKEMYEEIISIVLEKPISLRIFVGVLDGEVDILSESGIIKDLPKEEYEKIISSMGSEIKWKS